MASPTTLSSKKTVTTVFAVGLMLFSMFFGAGNLIFPPMLGIESGDRFAPAITGFLVAGVVLPVITIIAVAVSGSGVRDMASRAGVIFGVIFSVVVYLSIGSFYAMPRVAAIGYELGIESTFGLSGTGWRVFFTGLFFAVAFVIVLFPGKVADSLGKVLTPALLILLTVMTIAVIASMNNPPVAPTEEYASSPLIAGILQGYFTMDSIAALAFAIVVVSSFGAAGITNHKRVVKLSAISACIAGFFLMLVYLGLGFMGTRMPNKESYSDGAEILSSASKLTLGLTGDIIFSAVVLLACLTTAVGLIAASASFFEELLPQLSYRSWAMIFTVIAFTLANLGLERILTFSTPIIGLIYPPAIALIVTSLVHLLVPRRQLPLTYRTGVYVALIFSALDLIVSNNLFGAEVLAEPLAIIPLFSAGLGWMVPTVVAATIAFIFDMQRGLTRDDDLVSGEIRDPLQRDETPSSDTSQALNRS
ncbi:MULTISPECIES: branched-chain amino acid transport system II carrier protein [Auritidibacter]|uniref:Branched-chain amino acid transport system II carrier protein n=1 Tax=Auritidibacter ignavus TaxID=678932 RepID=A0AAJ6AH63_9MICC|nr:MULTISPECIES: branched-chain amino acid transport system II carrier protein [Auritidibacter]NIH71658.1 LIVCS family branched-chain amino acid:cation transporter [Auritidibacter ignavus]WGH81754.1 branched-chain amino acid transport system II carrier protein [Auritidibacter ignavus]WGH84013.1 branched-chain amino acid transport system II carrier protein [Auritidibacter ignavus]WGH86363.1 branched-chain amino acid transport system II carrier protein [Auritidibacter ignavus]WGH88647.1 branched